MSKLEDDEECPGCGSSLGNRQQYAKSHNMGDDEIPMGFSDCPFCGAAKCCMCDMGDDVDCISCNND